jgi:hypothetical protein
MYYITSFCHGPKYQVVKEKWIQRVKEKCIGAEIVIFDDITILKNSAFEPMFSGYIWALRLKHNINLLIRCKNPIVMCDLDVIVEKNLQPIVDLPYDIIVSTEIGGAESYPKECSKILGFGVCCGFMILKPSSTNFLLNIFKNMENKKYNTYDDQVNLMNHIVNNKYQIVEQDTILDNKKYTNKIIMIDDIKICVLDFNIITRDPLFNDGQFANHINIDNVGGSYNFLQYFDNDLETLPLTCRCGKRHLGDNNICKHIILRKNKLSNI